MTEQDILLKTTREALDEYTELGWDEADGAEILSEIETIGIPSDSVSAMTLGGLRDVRDKLRKVLDNLWDGAKSELLSRLSEKDINTAKAILLGYVITNSEHLFRLFDKELTPEEGAEVLALAVLWLLTRYRRDPLFYIPEH